MNHATQGFHLPKNRPQRFCVLRPNGQSTLLSRSSWKTSNKGHACWAKYKEQLSVASRQCNLFPSKSTKKILATPKHPYLSDLSSCDFFSSLHWKITQGNVILRHSKRYKRCNRPAEGYSSIPVPTPLWGLVESSRRGVACQRTYLFGREYCIAVLFE